MHFNNPYIVQNLRHARDMGDDVGSIPVNRWWLWLLPKVGQLINFDHDIENINVAEVS